MRYFLYLFIPALLLSLSTWLITRRLPGLTPRDLRGRYRLEFWLELPLNYLLICYGIRQFGAGKPLNGILALFTATCVVTHAFSAFGRQKRREAEENYQLDPSHCGQCNYDLTGNTTGVCPECGWQLTGRAAKAEKS